MLGTALRQSRVLGDFIAGMDRGGGSPQSQFGAAQSQFAAAVEAARAGGRFTDLSRVTGAAQALGELRIANGDGRYDSLAGDWRIGGRGVRLLRGAHRRPFHAPYAAMLPIARLRAAGAASGSSR